MSRKYLFHIIKQKYDSPYQFINHQKESVKLSYIINTSTLASKKGKKNLRKNKKKIKKNYLYQVLQELQNQNITPSLCLEIED